MKIRKVRNLVLWLTIIVIVSLVSFNLGRRSVVQVGESGKLDLTMMWRVKDRLATMYLDKEDMDDEDMAYGSIRGMVDSLDDPYTVFLPPEENKMTGENLAGEFGGVGISLGYKEKTLAVMSPLPNTPADKAGVKAGDLILNIVDQVAGVDESTAGISLGEAVHLIRGRIGTKVILKLFREGEDAPFDVELERGNIVVPSIELEWVEVEGDQVAWIKLYKFTERLFEDWPDMVDEISSKRQLGGIVLDLRDNPGGFLQGSVMVASDFLESGVVVMQESSDGGRESYEVGKSRGQLLGEKLVVLVNGGSASASEILAGALKDYGRAKLVGQQTFGKGTVQQPEDFSDGSGLHVTVARWLLPNGDNIDDEGVAVDVEIDDDMETEEDEQFDKAMEVLLGE